MSQKSISYQQYLAMSGENLKTVPTGVYLMVKAGEKPFEVYESAIDLWTKRGYEAEYLREEYIQS